VSRRARNAASSDCTRRQLSQIIKQPSSHSVPPPVHALRVICASSSSGSSTQTFSGMSPSGVDSVA
jgi:hypothetical protein